MTKAPHYKYFIRSKWPRRLETPAVIGAKFLKTLDSLSSIDPVLSDWKIDDFPNPSSGDEITDSLNMKAVPLAVARPRMTEIIENYVRRDDAYEPDPDWGYHASAATSEFSGPSAASISVDAGGKYGDGSTFFGFGLSNGMEPPDLSLVTYPLFKTVLLAVNAVWRAPWACAQAFRSGTVSVPNVEVAPGVIGTRIDSVAPLPLDPTFPYSIFHIPWIAYLSAEHAAGVTLPLDILTERTPDGGLLMSAATDRLDPDKPEHARRARMIADVMIARFGASSGWSRSAQTHQ
jgi:hypothetical protein